MILQSLAGLPAFLVYFCTAIIAVVAYLFVYTRVTPHNEFQLIRDNDPAAAIALGLSLLGFTLPVVSAIAHSANIVDCLIWSVIALIVQIVVYFIVKIRFRTCRHGSRRANSPPPSGSGLLRLPQARSTPPR